MAAADDAPGAARYRFPPLVRAGFFGSMPRSQAVSLVAGAAVALVAIVLHHVGGAFVALAGGCVIAFVKVGPHRWRLHEWLPLRIGFWRRCRTRSWFREIPLLGATGDEPVAIALPAPLVGLELFDVDARWLSAPGRIAGLGVVADRAAGFVTAVVRVTGDGQFSLTDPIEQDGRVALWGDALAGFCREGTAVERIGWSEWCTTPPRPRTAAPSPTQAVATAPHDGASTDAGDGGSGDGARRARLVERDGVALAQRSYRDLIGWAAPPAVTHDVLVTVTVNVAQARMRRTTKTVFEAALVVLSDEMRLFVARLETAGLRVDAPLSAVEITAAVPSLGLEPPAWGRSSTHLK